MDNVPVHVNRAASNGRDNGSHDAGGGKNAKLSRVKRFSLIGGIVVILLVLGLGGWTLYQTSTGSVIDNSEYQAVFFTNGQVYFGKLHTLNGSYMTLTDIYYLQANSTSTDSKNPQQTSSQQTSNVQLVKLGNEVHGPVDEMVINKDQVLFFENLKKDGKVSQSIVQYQQNQKK